MAAAVVEEPVDPADELMFLALGGGNEVGRSCHIIQYKGKTVMVRLPHWPLSATRSHANVAFDSLMLANILLMMAWLRCHFSTTST